MRRNKQKDWIWIAAILIFVISISEGIIYYQDTENGFIRVLLNIQNAIKAYKIDPDIKLKDAFTFYNSYSDNGDNSLFIGAITYVYSIALIIAPFCTVAALLSVLKTPNAYITGFFAKIRMKKPRVLIIGKGEYSNKFVNNLSKDCRVTIILEGNTSEEIKLSYIKKGITIINKYMDSGDRIWKGHPFKGYKFILLCDDDPLTNLKNFRDIENFVEVDGLHVYICTDNALIAETYRKCEKNKRNFIVSIVDMKMQSVNNMFVKHELHTVNKKVYDKLQSQKYDIHMGILGFGEFGQKVLIQGLNMATISAESKIRIDVFDKNMSNIFGEFLKNFSSEILNTVSRNEIEIIKGEKIRYYSLILPSHGNNKDSRLFDLDGIVELYFWEIDTLSAQFRIILNECNNKLPFTYFTIALSNMESMSSSTYELFSMREQNLFHYKTPIIVRTKDQYSIDLMDDICSIDQDNTIFSYNALIDNDINRNAQLFNYNYNLVYEKIKADEIKKDFSALDEIKTTVKLVVSESEAKNFELQIAEKWSMSLYNREASIAQSLHQSVKYWISLDRNGPMISDIETLMKIEHRRWTIYMITHGYRYDSITNKVIKTHQCISSWENLKKERPDTLVFDYIPYLIAKSL